MPAEHNEFAGIFVLKMRRINLIFIKIFGTIVIPRYASGFLKSFPRGSQKMSGTLTRLTLRALDSFARLLPRKTPRRSISTPDAVVKRQHIFICAKRAM